MKRKIVMVSGILIFTALAAAVILAGKRTGIDRFFGGDREFHYMTLRVMGDIPFGGAETGEVLSIISRIPEGDDERWYAEWSGAASRLEASARLLKNGVSRGHALLRAHCYYRNAEFFLPPSDPRRLAVFRKGRLAFYDGIDALGVRYEKIAVPFGKYVLNAVYYRAYGGDAKKPLLFTCGGFDSTLEEQYFLFIKAALERGYSCLSFEGPGQSSIIREQGLVFTHEWEKPSGAVLDEFLKRHESPRKIVMIGSSLGGYLAPRTAAYDGRIDGVVAFGTVYDFGEAAARKVPAPVRFLVKHGFRGVARGLMGIKMRFDTTTRWGVRHAQWVLGVKDPVDLVDAMSKYSLAAVAGRIRCHVLIVSGEKDHLVPVEQVDALKSKLVNARSVTTRIFRADEGGGEHCQMGAFTLFHEVLFDWIEKVIH